MCSGGTVQWGAGTVVPSPGLQPPPRTGTRLVLPPGFGNWSCSLSCTEPLKDFWVVVAVVVGDGNRVTFVPCLPFRTGKGGAGVGS